LTYSEKYEGWWHSAHSQYMEKKNKMIQTTN
jgi:hypothetical protein